MRHFLNIGLATVVILSVVLAVALFAEIPPIPPPVIHCPCGTDISSFNVYGCFDPCGWVCQ